MPETFRIDFQPLDRRGEARPGMSLLAAAQVTGVQIVAVCGGEGICGECRVCLTPPTAVEEDALKAGYRLADARLCKKLRETERIARRLGYVELTSHNNFIRLFVQELSFEERHPV